MYHIFFIHSLDGEHLGCFQVLTIMNNDVVNIVEQVSCGVAEHPLGICPRVVLLCLEID